MAPNKLNTMNVALERHPVPPGINPRRVVRSALLQTVPWLFGVACFTYVDRWVAQLMQDLERMCITWRLILSWGIGGFDSCLDST